MVKRRVALLVLTLVVSIATLSSTSVRAVSIHFMTYDSTPEKWGKLIGIFGAEHPDVIITHEKLASAEYNTKVQIMFAAGTPPDVFQTWAQYRPSWVKQGMLRDISALLNSSKVVNVSSIFPFLLDAVKVNGKIYGIPYDFNPMIWYYNNDWLGERGLMPPSQNWDVEDLRTYLTKLAYDVDGTATTRRYATYNPVQPENTGAGWAVQWYHNWTGNEWLNESRTKAMVDSPEVVEMLSYWKELQDYSHAIPPPGPYSSSDFFNGKVAMLETFLSQAFNFVATTSFEWGANVPVKGPKNQRAFGQAHMFSLPASGSGQKFEAAWRFAEWLGSRKGQEALIDSLGARQPISSYASLWNRFFAQLDPAKSAGFGAWVVSTLYEGNYPRSFLYWETFPEISKIMQEHVDNIFNKGEPIANEMSNAARRMQLVLDGKW